MALRRRLAGVVDVRISQEQQTAEVVLSGASAFSPSEFRAAVGEADVEVVHFEIEACGRFEEGPEGVRFVAGANRFAVPADASTQTVARCLAARLDDSVEPGRLEAIRPPARDPLAQVLALDQLHHVPSSGPAPVAVLSSSP